MVTSSLLHVKSDAFEFQIAPSAITVTAYSPSVANRGAHKTVAGLAFGVDRAANIAILLCQFTSTVSSLPMLW